MKRLGAVLVFGLLVVSFCVAQIQTGNASYNSSKGGFTISHPSLSFNTRVKVTNLANNRFVEAVVNGRIPISAERIADISRDAGDALEINKNGMTLVLLEILPPRVTEAPAENPVQTTIVPEPVPAPVPVPQQSAPPSVVTQTQILPLQTITDIEYVQVPAPAPVLPCCNARLILAIFLLLLLVIALLVAILVLLLRRLPPWPWHYPLWLRRRYRHYRHINKKSGKRFLLWLPWR
ncbi:MAG: septal ring lytic transglycosylase RlpA family protein [Treponema sp.]|jgi:hypothetical protein|nr:septal ring lytic transglycosylase RlpA family protein [Treponema sp.]